MELRMAWFVKELSNGLLIDPCDYEGFEYFSSYGYSTEEEALEAILKSDYHSINLVVLKNVYPVVVD
jgi:hypothetical protein